jgi:hypothetical protein
MTEVIHHHLNRAKQCMKRQADEHHSERQFQMDMVFVQIQPYVQSSLAQRNHQKLSSNSSDHIIYWLAWALLHTGLRSPLLHQCILYSTSHN